MSSPTLKPHRKGRKSSTHPASGSQGLVRFKLLEIDVWVRNGRDSEDESASKEDENEDKK